MMITTVRIRAAMRIERRAGMAKIALIRAILCTDADTVTDAADNTYELDNTTVAHNLEGIRMAVEEILVMIPVVDHFNHGPQGVRCFTEMDQR